MKNEESGNPTQCDEHRIEEKTYGRSWHASICLECLENKVSLMWTKFVEKR